MMNTYFDKSKVDVMNLEFDQRSTAEIAAIGLMTEGYPVHLYFSDTIGKWIVSYATEKNDKF